MIEPSIVTLASHIEETRKTNGKAFLSAPELTELCPKKDLGKLVNAQEASLIFSAMTGRHISTDYVKLLRLKRRLTVAKQVSERAYLFRLGDLFLVNFRERHKISDIGAQTT